MEQPIEIDTIIKTSSFSKKDRSIIIKDNKITFDGKCIELETVKEIKYDVQGIQFDMFFVGTRYLLDLRNDDEQFKLVLKSYFGVSKNYFTQLFSDVVNSIWQKTAVRLASEAIEGIIKGSSIKVGKCTANLNGVFVNDSLIQWKDLHIQKNYDKLTINNKSSPKAWTNLYYLEIYNVDVLIAIIDWVQAGGLKEIPEIESQSL